MGWKSYFYLTTFTTLYTIFIIIKKLVAYRLITVFDKLLQEDSPSGDEVGSGAASNTAGKKRGRRKRSTKKRQQQQLQQSSKDLVKKNNNQQSPVAPVELQVTKEPSPATETDIFTMDDIEISPENSNVAKPVKPSLLTISSQVRLYLYDFYKL